MAIHYNSKAKRFYGPKGFVKKSIALKSSIARLEYKQASKEQPQKAVFEVLPLSEMRPKHQSVTKPKRKESFDDRVKDVFSDAKLSSIDPYHNRKLSTLLNGMSKRLKTVDKDLFSGRKRKSSHHINVHFRIFDPDEGDSIVSIQFIRKGMKTRKQWAKMVKGELREIFVDRILDGDNGINNRRDTSYTLKNIISWDMTNADRQSNTRIREGNKTSSKGKKR